ncbi:MAG: hypothetical protein LQ350_008722 [Teloschistes chrysophthalmus]|nr:MAG: hypothetical protein LQ350_008722 [Niorma chrysophthalma]
MASSPPGSWPDQPDENAVPAPLKVQVRQQSPEVKRKQVPGKVEGKRGNGKLQLSEKHAQELPPEILEQELRVLDFGQSRMARRIANTSSLRPSSLTLPFLLDHKQCRYWPFHRREPATIETAIRTRG